MCLVFQFFNTLLLVFMVQLFFYTKIMHFHQSIYTKICALNCLPIFTTLLLVFTVQLFFSTKIMHLHRSIYTKICASFFRFSPLDYWSLWRRLFYKNYAPSPILIIWPNKTITWERIHQSFLVLFSKISKVTHFLIG